MSKRPEMKWIVVVSVFVVVQGALPAAPSDSILVTDSMWHHIRNAEPREWSHHPEKAEAKELVNSGAHTSDPMQLVRDWFALVRSGHRMAGIGGSDSHTVNFAIPGQARTYVECPDADLGKLDSQAAVDSFVKQRTWVSFGLLARLDKTSEGKFVATVLGPSWSRAGELRIFRNGEEVKLARISESDGKKPGEKLSVAFSLEDLGAKAGDFLCAVATGPGITEAWWPGMVPYQPVSPDWKPFVMGVSPVVWVGEE